MTKLVFVGLLTGALVYTLLVGFPMQLVVGKLNVQGGNIHYTAPSSGLAKLVTFSPRMKLRCDSLDICVRTRDAHQKLSNVPITIEACTQGDVIALKACRNAELVLQFTTAEWVKSSFVNL